jgi:hypothetical protein
MKLHLKIAIVVGALALATAPAAALATQPEDPGSQGKAYGSHCKEESRRHVAGEKGTPFSQCVTAMAKAANHKNMSPGQACKGTIGKHVKGEEGTPHSRCVAEAVKLKKELRETEAAQV